MTLKDCAKLYYVSIDYHVDDDLSQDGWSWYIECGYQSFWSNKGYETAAECQTALETFLETWEGPTK
jgi:hypothetical protein